MSFRRPSAACWLCSSGLTSELRIIVRAAAVNMCGVCWYVSSYGPPAKPLWHDGFVFWTLCQQHFSKKIKKEQNRDMFNSVLHQLFFEQLSENIWKLWWWKLNIYPFLLGVEFQLQNRLRHLSFLSLKKKKCNSLLYYCFLRLFLYIAMLLQRWFGVLLNKPRTSLKKKQNKMSGFHKCSFKTWMHPGSSAVPILCELVSLVLSSDLWTPVHRRKHCF